MIGANGATQFEWGGLGNQKKEFEKGKRVICNKLKLRNTVRIRALETMWKGLHTKKYQNAGDRRAGIRWGRGCGIRRRAGGRDAAGVHKNRRLGHSFGFGHKHSSKKMKNKKAQNVCGEIHMTTSVGQRTMKNFQGGVCRGMGTTPLVP